MIAVDSSAFVHFLDGTPAAAAHAVRAAVSNGDAHLPPIVVAELCSRRTLNEQQQSIIVAIPQLAIHEGYWQRAGLLRRELLLEGLRANLADCLIAQSCIDHDIPLITYDRDFRHFVRAGLKFA